jgi:hypothetical protein
LRVLDRSVGRERNVSQDQKLAVKTDGTGSQYRQSIPKAARLRHPSGLLAAGRAAESEPLPALE